MRTVPKPPVIGDTPHHPAWCATHVDETNVCLGAITIIDVTADPAWLPTMANALSVGLSQCAEDGLTVDLSIDFRGPNEVPVSVARQYALAILAECERAGVPLVPGPRVEVKVPSYAQTVTYLAREYRAAKVNGRITQDAHQGIVDRLVTAAAIAGICEADALDDLFDEVAAPPVQSGGAK